MLSATVLLVLSCGLAETANAQVVRAFTSRFSSTDRGNFVAIGNTLMTCPDSASACAAARAGTGNTNNNQDFPMVAVDVDAVDPGANSSEATLTIPTGSTVRFAGLYWGASSSSAARNQVRFRTPGASAYNSLNASQLDASGNAYQGFADVTTLVSAGGSGGYTVADVKATTGTNAYAGWSLIVVYADAAETPHNVTVFDGYATVAGGGGVNTSVSGFATPPIGTVSTRLAVVAYEGDLGSPGNSLKLNSVVLSNAVNPANNFFNSTISRIGAHISAKTPNYVNQLGFDIDTVDASGILPNSATSAAMQFAGGSDTYLPGVLTFSTEVYQPLVTPNFTKTVSDLNGGFVAPGDVLEYTVTVGNTGNDSADAVVLTDVIPAGAAYVPGSLSIVSGANAGGKTDASGDDQAEMDTPGNRVVFRLGTGATSAAGGSLAEGLSTTARFRVQIAPATANGTTLSNTAQLTYTERQLGGAIALDSNVVRTQVNLPNLTLTKSHSGNFVRGSSGTYLVSVTNSGVGATSGTVTTTDTVPAGLTPTAASGSGWACSIASQTVTCTRNDSLGAGETFPTISITVAIAQGAAATLTNTATASGGGEQDASDSSGSDPTTIVSRSDLAITKTGPASVLAGGNVVYTVSVTNNGSSDAASVSVADTTPTGLTFISNAGDCTTTYPCSLGAVATGTTRTITSTYSVPLTYSASSILNTAAVSSATIDPVSSNNSSTFSTTVPPSTDLSISKTGPVSVTTGTNIVYTVTVANNGGLSAAAVSVADMTPTGLTFVSNTGACTTAYPCSLGAVAAGATQTITTTYSVPSSYTTPDPIVNTATVSSSTTDPVSANNSSTASTPVSVSADLAISKTGPASVVAGDNVVFTVAVTNNGSSDAASVSVADATPAGLMFVANTGACTTAYPCSLGSVAAGATRTITTTYLVPSSYTTPSPIVNTATVSSPTTDPTSANNSSTSSTPVSVSADLAISKAGPASATAGANLVYTVVVTNNGSSDAASVSVADATPTGLTFVSNAGACITAYPCSLGTITAGATRTITTTYSVPSSYTAPDPIVNAATVSSSTSDPDSANDSSTSSTPVSVSADLAIAKTGPGSATPGTNLVYTVVVTNNGSADAAFVTVADATPTGLTFVSNTGACTTAYPCSLGSVAAGATRTITTTYSVPSSYTAPNPILNTATVSSSTSDPDSANDSSTSSTPVSVSADLAIAKTGPASVTPGTNLVYTVVVTNNGSSDADSVTVADATPAGLTFVSNTGDCAAAYPCSLGTVAAGATRTITTTYSVPSSYTTPTPIVNTASVSSPTTDPVSANNSSTASTPVSVSADLAISKTGPVAVIAGSDLVYTVTITNVGASDAAAVLVTDPTPAGLVFVANTGACTTAYPCSLGGVAAGATRTITTTYSVPLSYMTPNPIVNTATVSSSSADPVPGNNSSTASTILTIINGELEVAKSGPASVVPGTNLVYTIVLTNNGPDDATSTVLADPTPGGLTFLSNTGACTTAFPCAMGTVAAGATRTVTTTYLVPASYTTPDPIVNTASVSSGVGDSNSSNNSSTVSTLLDPQADLSLTKAGPASVVAGSSIVYTVTVANNGISDAASVSVVDPAPSGLVFVSNSGACTTTFPCALGTVAAGATRTITTTYSVPSSYRTPNPILSTATVSSPTSDPVAGNNSSTSSTSVSTSADVSVTKTDATDPIGPGELEVYTVTVSNSGPSDATGVVVVDTLDPNTTYDSDTGGCSETSGVLTCSYPAIPAGSQATFTVTVLVGDAAPTGGTLGDGPCDGTEDLCNTVDVTANESDPNATNGSAGEPTDVELNQASDLSLRVTDTPDPVLAGSTLTYTLTWSNTGVDTITNAELVETYDARTAFASASPTPGVGNNRWLLGDLAPGQVGEIVVQLTVNPATLDGAVLLSRAVLRGDFVPSARAEEETTVRTDLSTHASLSVVKTTAPNPVPSGGLLTYTITVANGGPATSYGTVVRDPLPAGVTYLNASPLPDLVAGNSLTWNAGDLPSGTSATYTVYASSDATLSAGSLIENVAYADGSTGPGTVSSAGLSAEGSDTASTSGSGGDCGLVIRLRSVGLPLPGDEIVYRSLWLDPCSEAPSSIVVQDLPPEVEFVSLSSGNVLSFTVVQVGDHQRVVLDIGPLPQGRAGTAYIRVRIREDAAAGTVLTSVIRIDDAAGRTASDTDEITVRSTTETSAPLPSLRVTGPLRTVVDGTPQYMVRYYNLAPDSSLLLTLTDNFIPSFVSSSPSVIEDGTVRSVRTFVWNGLEGSGVLKVKGRAVLDDPAAASGVISVDAIATAADGSEVVKAGCDTAVQWSVSGGTTTTARSRVALSAQRFARPGMTSVVQLRFQRLTGATRATMNLPGDVTFQTAYPEPATSNGNVFEWTDLAVNSGSIRVTVLVSAQSTVGTSLTFAATVTDEVGTIGLESATTLR